MKKKYSISIKWKGQSYIFVNNLQELIEELENLGISNIDIENFTPWDDTNIIHSDLSIYDITKDIFDNLAKSKQGAPHIVPVKTNSFPIVPKGKMIEETYLPFKEEQLKKYFSNSKHIKYYTDSAKNYQIWKNAKKNIKHSEYKLTRQIEKDERFWVAQTFITIFEQLDRKKIIIDLKKILIKAFGETPPLNSFDSWSQALNLPDNEKFILRFEENIPSSLLYKDFLSENLTKRHIIPYVLESGSKNKTEFRKNLEGTTNVDALIINPSNGFNIFIEAKVLSDISYQVSYDIFRNQIARNIDVMTSNHEYKDKDFRLKMNKDKSVFLLLTPEAFKNNSQSRLYCYKMKDYMSNPLTLMADLNHRTDIESYQWDKISKRISWVTWEDFNKLNRNCCNWL